MEDRCCNCKQTERERESRCLVRLGRRVAEEEEEDYPMSMIDDCSSLSF